MKKLEMEFQLQQISLGQYAKKLDVDKIESKLDNYTPAHIVDSLKEDIFDRAQNKDLLIITKDVEILKKNLGKFMPSDEV